MIRLSSILLVALLGVLPAAVSAQSRPVLAVAEFKNESGAGWWRGGVGWELSGMLANELVATDAFRVVERTHLESVLQEQNLAASGRVSPGDGARIGRLAGAEYLVMGTVTAYEERTAGRGGGISIRGISVGGRSEEAYLAVDLRVVNAETGEIEFVRTIEGRTSGGGVRIGVSRGGFGGALENESRTPAGEAIRAALIEITDYLECAMVLQDRCMDQYREREDRRRERSRGALRF